MNKLLRFIDFKLLRRFFKVNFAERWNTRSKFKKLIVLKGCFAHFHYLWIWRYCYIIWGLHVIKIFYFFLVLEQYNHIFLFNIIYLFWWCLCRLCRNLQSYFKNQMLETNRLFNSKCHKILSLYSLPRKETFITRLNYTGQQ